MPTLTPCAWPRRAATLLLLAFALSGCVQTPVISPQPSVHAQSLDDTVRLAMAATGTRGLALAVVDDGQLVFTKAYGVRNASGDPLQEDTVMYGASLTKAAFGYLVMQLVEEGKLGLDVPMANYLPQPLPSYASPDIVRRYSAFAGLARDERWRRLTARMLLTHSSGFANFYFLEPDQQLRIHFEPGSRYAYSGDGLILLQFVLEQGLGLDVGAEMNRRIFAPNGMSRSSLIWRPDFRPNLADGFTLDGLPEPHDERSRVRVSGSMDTSIADMGLLAASYVRGDGLSAAARAELTRPQLPITTRSQFPSLQPTLATTAFPSLGAGLGVIAFTGPQGAGFFKGGHNDSTANMWVCIEAKKRCLVMLSNDVRAEPAFPALVRSILGETGLPWTWEYGDMKFWSPEP
ncbi:serine hydrolase [Paucibacter aquatile]|uniref:Serine hydrolase n=1 Tax=Kinneretia aquatilis TaxID=2070761 RepID=A0A2N8KZN4_9BURK|nr:serine hydrolase domain-containing protein [Paucibacter aquatile]PND38928.1 serine hydrolase [Paucibacter aquatile]